MLRVSSFGVDVVQDFKEYTLRDYYCWNGYSLSFNANCKPIRFNPWSMKGSYGRVLESLSPQVVSAAKLPILNPNEFDLWKIRIEHYFLMTDYSLWEVILNGDSPLPIRVTEGVVQPVAPTTAKQRLAKKNELKAQGTLLMALPDKPHPLGRAIPVSISSCA
uniref:Uncharacterized protein n=1 Tax=Tanacetum cinerariifolium TaxID=118510 RepID=A0A699GMX4_TANCI|nr:hypothetical protein [Tanacetum cinerariifolium]